eukprot:COSAG03_NODE_19136_length_342_cov_0.831276_1_plen_42_part_01
MFPRPIAEIATSVAATANHAAGRLDNKQVVSAGAQGGVIGAE